MLVFHFWGGFHLWLAGHCLIGIKMNPATKKARLREPVSSAGLPIPLSFGSQHRGVTFRVTKVTSDVL
jgi:hypothetical protein